jgi:mono/diheme cytochrome c family protein
MKKIVVSFVAFCAVALLVVAGIVLSGVISVAADDPHTGVVHAFLETARNRSIEVRSDDIAVPALDDEEQIRAGAGNYDSMCVGCHLAPGMAATELSDGLYPSPPKLAEAGIYGDPAKTFWVIKHGIKATGMPAWGKSMADSYIWQMVAFLQKLPDLDEEAYRALVASSGGHQHGGGETPVNGQGGHHGEVSSGEHHGSGHHGGGDSDDHSASAEAQAEGHSAGSADAKEKAPSNTHTHADGKQHQH